MIMITTIQSIKTQSMKSFILRMLRFIALPWFSNKVTEIDRILVHQSFPCLGPNQYGVTHFSSLSDLAIVALRFRSEASKLNQHSCVCWLFLPFIRSVDTSHDSPALRKRLNCSELPVDVITLDILPVRFPTSSVWAWGHLPRRCPRTALGPPLALLCKLLIGIVPRSP